MQVKARSVPDGTDDGTCLKSFDFKSFDYTGRPFCEGLFIQWDSHPVCSVLRLDLFLEIVGIETVLLEQQIEIGPIFSCQLGRLADFSLTCLEEVDEVTTLEYVLGLF